MVTLVQTKKMVPVPIVCVGTDFWSPLDSWIRSKLLLEMGTVAPGDPDLYKIVNTAEETFDLIKGSKERQYF